MKKYLFLVLISLLIVGFGFVGVVFAKGKPITVREMHMMREESILNNDHEFALVCSGEITHPVLMSLADTHEEDYDVLRDYFCDDDFGVGEIRLALITAERDDVALTFEQILQMRFDNGMKKVGWGLIWQELGLIGRGRQNHKSDNGSEGMNNKPSFPPGLGGVHPGKGVGPNK